GRRTDAERPAGGALESNQDRGRARVVERRARRTGDDSDRSGRGSGRGRSGMSRAALRRSIGALGVAAALAWCAGASLAQPSGEGATQYGPRDIGGTWERYPSQFAGLGSDDNAPARPQPVPDPPLKPEYYAEWRKAQDEAAALTAAGRPPATHYTHCIGDGMPGMMMAMFPMEVLVTGDQVTVIQEAYNQVRRIYIGEEAPPPEDAEPRFAGHSGAHWE